MCRFCCRLQKRWGSTWTQSLWEGQGYHKVPTMDFNFQWSSATFDKSAAVPWKSPKDAGEETGPSDKTKEKAYNLQSPFFDPLLSSMHSPPPTQRGGGGRGGGGRGGSGPGGRHGREERERESRMLLLSGSLVVLHWWALGCTSAAGAGLAWEPWDWEGVEHLYWMDVSGHYFFSWWETASNLTNLTVEGVQLAFAINTVLLIIYPSWCPTLFLFCNITLKYNHLLPTVALFSGQRPIAQSIDLSSIFCPSPTWHQVQGTFPRPGHVRNVVDLLVCSVVVVSLFIP